ncbi:MAG TPA: carbon storage regulator [Anaerolineales bacterium]
MLVHTRRSEESIVIGGNIVLTILSAEGEKVKLGIEAPREIEFL